jgi:peptide/nickel transport system permease protein
MAQAQDVIAPELHLTEPHQNIAVRVFIGLKAFARRKPLGAAGGSLVALILLASLLLPGLDLGLVTLPQLTRYSISDAQLGQDILEGPSNDHFFGTDRLGRDMFARVLVGVRNSMIIGGSVFAISIILSTALTLFSAYYIRTIDLLMQRVFEIIAFLPDLILIVTMLSIFGATPLALIVILGVLRGFNDSKVLRALVIGVRAQPYIEAARTLGASNNRIILRHVFPNVAYFLVITATNAVAVALVIESGLAILGIGVDPNTPTIGNLLNDSRNHFRVAPYLALIPGLALFALLLGLRLLGDALRDVMDPRLRGEGR